MDLGRLGKKARNELMRNPKKSAILGVICLVALYFWLPLLRGWLTGGARKPAKSSVQIVATSTPTAVPELTTPAETSASTARAQAAYRWDKQVRQRKADPLMSPAVMDAAVRNPFRLSEDMRRELAAVREPEIKEPVTKVVVPPTVELAPKDLGLVLKGTLVGSRSSRATINGPKLIFRQGAEVIVNVSTPYREGEQVQFDLVAPGNDSSSDQKNRSIEFTLAKVRNDSVVLTRGDKSFTLEFPKGGLAPTSRITQETPNPISDAAVGDGEE